MSSETSEEYWPGSVTPELRSSIIDVIVEQGMLDRKLMKPGATLDELNFDSLEAIMVINGIEDAFGIELGSDLQLGDAQNLGELVALLAKSVERAVHHP